MADPKIIRRSGNYPPSVWSDEYIQSLSSQYKDELYVQQNEVLKEEVRGILCKLIDHADQLEMIDVLQRLGVFYHFKNEIRNILKNIHNNIEILKNKENLHVTSLAFRLLRQHKFNISTDVFINLHDTMCNFKKCLSVDVEGLLSLYEASFHSLENEPILDEATNFTTNFLKEFVKTNRDTDMSLLINHALEFPLHWTLPRMEALWFINFLNETRKNVNRSLIEFAELDFNIVQSIHQEELKNTSRWWKNSGLFKELRFFRDRPVENFLWAVDMNFKPELGYFREIIAKVNCFLTILDDLYDVYGTLEELELFTEVIISWDLINAMDNLPHYMKVIFLALYNFVNDVAFHNLKENGYNTIPYLKKVWTDLCKSYLVEAKWFYNGYTPKLQEYMENAWISIAVPVGLMNSYLLLSSPSKKEDLVCLEKYPDIIQSSATISRLADDIGSLKRELEMGDVPKSIQCYMHETGASNEESSEHIRCMMHKTWKKMNGEALNSSLSENLIDTTLNLTRAALLFYQHGDGFSLPNRVTKSRIRSLVMEPLSIISK